MAYPFIIYSLSMRDFYFGAFAGLITGILLIPIFKNLDIPIPFAVAWIPAAITILFGVGVLVARVLSRWALWFFQLSKFIATGFMNTAIDFGILNLLIFLSGTAAGAGYIAFKAVSFFTANINSYIWNRWWVFKKDASPRQAIAP